MHTYLEKMKIWCLSKRHIRTLIVWGHKIIYLTRIFSGFILFGFGVYLINIRQLLPIVGGILLIVCGITLILKEKWVPDRILMDYVDDPEKDGALKWTMVSVYVATVIAGLWSIDLLGDFYVCIFLLISARTAYKRCPIELPDFNPPKERLMTFFKPLMEHVRSSRA